MAKIHLGNLGQKLTRERTLWVNNKVGRFSRSAIFDFITVRTSNKDLCGSQSASHPLGSSNISVEVVCYVIAKNNNDADNGDGRVGKAST